MVLGEVIPLAEAKFEDADGQKVSAREWHDDNTEPHEKQEITSYSWVGWNGMMGLGYH